MTANVKKIPGDLKSIVPHLSLYLSVLSLGCVWIVPVKQRNNSQERFLRPMHTKVPSPPNTVFLLFKVLFIPFCLVKEIAVGSGLWFMLGLMYKVGVGVPKNYTEAIKW